MRKVVKLTSFAVFFFAAGWLACLVYEKAGTKKQARVEAVDVSGKDALETVTIRKIVDGDSGKFADGREFRLVGIDAPEKKKPFADTASAFARKLLENKQVYLEEARESKDRYNRVLAWVWYGKGKNKKLANAEMIRQGLAYVYHIPPNGKYLSLLLDAQKTARGKSAGIWSKSRSKPEKYYIVSRRLTHRPSCSKVRKQKASKKRFETFSEAVDTGAPPCRSCAP